MNLLRNTLADLRRMYEECILGIGFAINESSRVAVPKSIKELWEDPFNRMLLVWAIVVVLVLTNCQRYK